MSHDIPADQQNRIGENGVAPMTVSSQRWSGLTVTMPTKDLYGDVVTLTIVSSLTLAVTIQATTPASRSIGISAMGCLAMLWVWRLATPGLEPARSGSTIALLRGSLPQTTVRCDSPSRALAPFQNRSETLIPSAMMLIGAAMGLAAFAGGGTPALITAFTAVGLGGTLAAARHVTANKVAEQLRAELTRNQQDLVRQALHDPLTGQASRPLFTFRLDCALQDTGRTSLAVLMCDLNSFKSINDDLGHTVGDGVLAKVAWRLNSHLPPGATLARTGADEFGVILGNLEPATAQRAAEAMARDLNTALDSPIVTDGRRISAEMTIGIVVVHRSGEEVDVNEVMRRADIALQTARRRSSTEPVTYTSGLSLPEAQDWQLRPAVARALRSGAILPYYQAVVDLTTGKVRAFEALARWEQPPFTPAAARTPDSFLPVITRAGLLPELTERMLIAAATQQNLWHARDCGRATHDSNSKVRITINVSPASIVDPSFPSRVHDVLVKHQLSGQDIIMEITEERLLDDLPAAEAVLKQLNELGIRIWLDDFGSGYSSLAMLHQLPLEAIKLDKGLIRNIGTDRSLQRMVGGLIALGHDLQLEVVAEGIQRFDQIRTLRDLGCELGQGFLFSRPLPANECADLIARRGLTDRRKHSPATANPEVFTIVADLHGTAASAMEPGGHEVNLISTPEHEAYPPFAPSAP